MNSLIRTTIYSLGAASLTACCKLSPPAPLCVNFESLSPGTVYNLNDTFIDSGITMRVTNFTWGNGNPAPNPRVNIDNGQNSGGSGLDARLNNGTLSFGFGPVDKVSLRYGDYGGNENLVVNGSLLNVGDISDQNGVNVGGATITITTLSTNISLTIGDLIIEGDISSFGIGGQELWIDEVCAS